MDRLAVLRNQVFMLDHMYMSLFGTFAWVLRLGVTIALLMSIHPALALLAVFAVPPVFTSTWRPAVERQAYERGASRPVRATPDADAATAPPKGSACHRHPATPDREGAAWERCGPVASALEFGFWHTIAGQFLVAPT
jgi:ATP-binding cassette subfamily B protein